MYTRYKSKKGLKIYILATYWNLPKGNLVIWILFFSKCGEFGPFFFFHENSFAYVRIIFFRSKLGKEFANNKKAGGYLPNAGPFILGTHPTHLRVLSSMN